MCEKYQQLIAGACEICIVHCTQYIRCTIYVIRDKAGLDFGFDWDSKKEKKRRDRKRIGEFITKPSTENQVR